jgi:hypothetical protein
MPKTLFHLRYSLSRGQRLAVLLRMWGMWSALLCTTVVTFFVVRAIVGLCMWAPADFAVFGLLAAFFLFLLRPLFVGLADVLLIRARMMDMTVEEAENGTKAAGVLLGRERWYLFLDGITAIRQDRKGIWTIRHVNGTILHVPASAISPEQLDCLRHAMAEGHTPEGIKAVIERGRQIQELTKRTPRP